MLSGISRKRSIRSNTFWFTEFCNSQCLSHFAAPFIVVRAETSVAESCSETWCNAPFKDCAQTNTPNSKRYPTARTGKEDGPIPPSLLPASFCTGASTGTLSPSPSRASHKLVHNASVGCVRMILPQVHLRKPCYDFSFL